MQDRTFKKGDSFILDTRRVADKPDGSFDIESIEPEQVKYLEMLSKFSPLKNQIKEVKTYDVPEKKLIFIKENFSYLTQGQQVEFNDSQSQQLETKRDSYYVGGFSGASAFLYYLMSTPTTRKLGKEGLKSIGFGAFFGWMYFRFNQEAYYQNLQSTYITIVKEKQRNIGKRIQLQQEFQNQTKSLYQNQSQ